MKMYIEMFKNIDLRPCELVAIREIAVEYRRQLLLKYHVSDEKELQPYIETWGTYDEAIQYSYLLMCNQIVEKIPKIQDYILEQGFLVEADAGSRDKFQCDGADCICVLC